MKITVEGTPKECEALCDVLKNARLSSETPILINVQVSSKPSLTLIQGGKSESTTDDRRKPELPVFP